MWLRIYVKKTNLSTYDLSALEAIKLEGKLVDYDVFQYVPSDLAPSQLFLPPDIIKHKITMFTYFNGQMTTRCLLTKKKKKRKNCYFKVQASY